jgi:triosephosphate isomerase
MLRDIGCSYVIIGHSERRQFYNETDDMVNRKIGAALGAGLLSIVCVGEKLEERDGGEMERVVARQLQQGLAGLTASDLSRILIAYEPVWAIGTGRTATPDLAASMHRFIRGTVSEGWGGQAAAEMRILYGGSVKPDNVVALMAEPDIDGALVGGASLEADSFARIVNYQTVVSS